MARIFILSAGIGDASMAYEIKETVGKIHDVIVIFREVLEILCHSFTIKFYRSDE